VLRTPAVSTPAARDKDPIHGRNRHSIPRPAKEGLPERSVALSPPTIGPEKIPLLPRSLSPPAMPPVVHLEAVPLVVGTLALATMMVVGDGNSQPAPMP